MTPARLAVSALFLAMAACTADPFGNYSRDSAITSDILTTHPTAAEDIRVNQPGARFPIETGSGNNPGSPNTVP